MEPSQDAKSTPNQTCENCRPNLKERYQFAIDARQFHYDNYSKWMTYFYVAMAALLVALYTIAKEPEFDNKQLYLTAILLLGFMVGWLWYLSSKGYYYWSLNFIRIINHYEINLFQWEDDKRVYSFFANKEKNNDYCNPISSANISTSKSAILFAFLVTLFWGTLLVHHGIYHIIACPKENQVFIVVFSIIFSGIIILVLSATLGKKYLRSNTDYMADLRTDFPDRTKLYPSKEI